MKTKEKVVAFRVTKKEFEEIRKSAEKVSRSVSNWVRLMIVGEGK